MEVEKRSYSRSRSAGQRGEVRDSRTSKTSPRKRTYQRDQNSRKSGWQSQNENPASSLNDDLRSPCHKHPRYKGQKESNLTDKPRSKGPWNKKFESRKEDNETTLLEKEEFPPLGFHMDRFTPESNKDWGSIVDEEEEQLKQATKENQKPPKFKRRLVLSASDSTETKDSTKPLDNEEDKTKGKVLRPIITDQHKLTQRQKQIDIGKNTVSYGQYIKNTQRQERSKEDPWTPDKFQQCSTRSWVGQIKVWRRRLHKYDLDSKCKEDLFSTSSASSSQATDDLDMEVEVPQNKSKSIEDMFEGFDLDSCLHDDGYPL